MTSAQMIRTLEENSFNALQARTLVDVWETASERRDEKLVTLLTQTFATKEDIAKLQGQMLAIEQKQIGRTTLLQQELEAKMESLEQRLTGRMESLEQRLTGRTESLEQRLTGRMESLEQRLTGRMDVLEARMTSLEEKMTAQFALADRNVRTQLAEFRSEILKWVFALLIAQSSVVLGAVVFIVSKLP